MNISAAQTMTARQAIDRAMGFFRDFYAKEHTKNVLLEELDYDDDDKAWMVRIGFDIGRNKTKQPGFNLGGLISNQEVLPIRETRVFVISDADGALRRMGAD